MVWARKNENPFGPVGWISSSILFVFLLLLISQPCVGQSVKEFLKTGGQQYKAKEYSNALKTYQEGLRHHPKDAQLNFQAGLTYLSLPNKAESLRYLQTAFTLDPNVDANLYYFLGLSYQSNRQFEKAQEFFEEFKKRNKKLAAEVDKKIRQSQFADSLTKVPSNVVVENVGKAINSSFHEYSPLVSLDGNTMVFTSNRPDSATSGSNVPRFEDIYISKKVNGQWTLPKKISPNINIQFNDAAASLSSDGKTLILYYEYGGGDIYVSRRDGEDWTKPIPLNENINTPDFWETSAFLTNDGQKLYFTSNRPGGVGNLDIYVSEMEETGDWGKASNLGPVINTPGREDSPALDPDGLTLYFSSDGHPTMGGTDIFKSEFKDGKWQKPVNLGYPINSIEDDSFFSLTNDRQRAYFSTLREEGNAEIYTLTFIEPSLEIASVINPTPTIQSSPTSSSTPSQAVENKPVPTTTTTTTTATQTTATQTQTQTPTTTTTTTTTPTPTATTQTASAATPSRNVSTSPSSRERSSESVTPPVSDDDFARIFLFFAIGRDDLSDEAMLKLVNLNVSLARDLQRHILIEGHTDNTGSDLLNKALSVKRANTVAKFLTQQGVDPRRLSLKAYGATRPAVSNDDELGGREINRRIEISAAR